MRSSQDISKAKGECFDNMLDRNYTSSKFFLGDNAQYNHGGCHEKRFSYYPYSNDTIGEDTSNTQQIWSQSTAIKTKNFAIVPSCLRSNYDIKDEVIRPRTDNISKLLVKLFSFLIFNLLDIQMKSKLSREASNPIFNYIDKNKGSAAHHSSLTSNKMK